MTYLSRCLRTAAGLALLITACGGSGGDGDTTEQEASGAAGKHAEGEAGVTTSGGAVEAEGGQVTSGGAKDPMGGDGGTEIGVGGSSALGGKTGAGGGIQGTGGSIGGKEGFGGSLPGRGGAIQTGGMGEGGAAPVEGGRDATGGSGEAGALPEAGAPAGGTGEAGAGGQAGQETSGGSSGEAGAAQGGVAGEESGGSGFGGVMTGGTGGGPPSCELASDCAIVPSCCVCMIATVGTVDPTNCAADCEVPLCESMGFDNNDVGCVANMCGLSKPNNCNAEDVLCNALPPVCPPDYLPSVVDRCWGPCIHSHSCVSGG